MAAPSSARGDPPWPCGWVQPALVLGRRGRRRERRSGPQRTPGPQDPGLCCRKDRTCASGPRSQQEGGGLRPGGKARPLPPSHFTEEVTPGTGGKDGSQSGGACVNTPCNRQDIGGESLGRLGSGCLPLGCSVVQGLRRTWCGDTEPRPWEERLACPLLRAFVSSSVLRRACGAAWAALSLASMCSPKYSLPPYQTLPTIAPVSSGLPLHLDLKEIYCFTLAAWVSSRKAQESHNFSI